MNPEYSVRENVMKNTYKGHSNEFTVKIENIPFPEGHGNRADQDAVLELIKDLGGHMSVRSKTETIKWLLDKIKEHDEIADNRTNHYENSVEEIKKYI